MKKYINAVKLYMQAAVNPLTVIFMLTMLGGMVLAFTIDPDRIGDEDYLSMLGSVQTAHIGLFLFMLFGGTKIQQSKFYISCGCGKELLTAASVIALTCLSLTYDVAIAIVAAIRLGGAEFSDVVLVNSFSTVLMVYAGSCYAKKGLALGFSLPYLGVLISSMLLGKGVIVETTFGISPFKAVAAAAVIYILGVTAAVVTSRIWWKRCDRCTMPDVFSQTITGGK
ncbi:MAG: hypothetical protein IJ806_06660 [Ruminococcus sp.]|nr:hypothetical protein [Ruminococcus sp.]